MSTLLSSTTTIADQNICGDHIKKNQQFVFCLFNPVIQSCRNKEDQLNTWHCCLVIHTSCCQGSSLRSDGGTTASQRNLAALWMSLWLGLGLQQKTRWQCSRTLLAGGGFARLEGRRMLSCWLRELFLTPWYKPSTPLPEHACGVWDFHQVLKGEAELQNYEVPARIYSLFSILNGCDFTDSCQDRFSCFCPCRRVC